MGTETENWEWARLVRKASDLEFVECFISTLNTYYIQRCLRKEEIFSPCLISKEKLAKIYTSSDAIYLPYMSPLSCNFVAALNQKHKIYKRRQLFICIDALHWYSSEVHGKMQSFVFPTSLSLRPADKQALWCITALSSQAQTEIQEHNWWFGRFKIHMAQTSYSIRNLILWIRFDASFQIHRIMSCMSVRLTPDWANLNSQSRSPARKNKNTMLHTELGHTWTYHLSALANCLNDFNPKSARPLIDLFTTKCEEESLVLYNV